jgi:hypothetical protein
MTAAANELGTVGLVAMADLSACRTDQAPGAFREEAAGFDASVAEAFRSGDPAPLLNLDPALAADLLVAGRVPLQSLAGAFAPGPVPGSHRSIGARERTDGEPPVSGNPEPSGKVPVAGGSGTDGGVPMAGGSALRGQVLYEDAPYGVGYLVAVLAAPRPSPTRPSAPGDLPPRPSPVRRTGPRDPQA